MSFPRYPEYKDSGVEWLGQIPAHWEVARLGAAFQEVSDLGNDELPILSVSIHDGVSDRELDEAELDRKVSRSEDRSKYKAVRPGDLAYNMMRAWQGGFGAVTVSGQVSPAYVVARPTRGAQSAYVEQLLRTPQAIEQMRRHSRGVTDFRMRLYWEEFKNIRVPMPPATEQESIVALIAKEAGKIDALVAEQEKLIALLKEKRQALVSQFVTMGIDPSAPMQNSDIEWLGQVPAHWNVHRLKLVATVQTGIAKGKDYSGVETISVPYLRVANVQDGYLDLVDVTEIEIPVGDVERYKLQAGDVLMNEGGDFDKLGRGAIWHGEIETCIHQNHVFAVRPHSVLPPWLNAVTGSDYAQFYFMGRSKQSTNLASISSTNLMELPVTVPPEDEQLQILDVIADQSHRLDVLRRESEHAIELLKERRSALISAAVTGRIMVAAQLPTECEESQ